MLSHKSTRFSLESQTELEFRRRILEESKKTVQTIFKNLPQKNWLLTKDEYNQIAGFNKLLKLAGTSEEKLELYKSLSLEIHHIHNPESEQSKLFMGLLKHLQTICTPELDNALQQLFPVKNKTPHASLAMSCH